MTSNEIRQVEALVEIAKVLNTLLNTLNDIESDLQGIGESLEDIAKK